MPASVEKTTDRLKTSLRKALFLSERLNGSCNGTETIPHEQVEQWMNQWEEACGGSARLDKRLEWSGLTRDKVREELRERSASESLLEETHERITRLLSSLDDDNLPRLPAGVFQPESDEENPRLFPEAYEPFLRRCWADLVTQLEESGTNKLEQFGDKARAKLIRSLFLRLSNISSRTLFEQFDNRRPAGDRMVLNLTGGSGETTDEFYDPFISDLLSGGWGELFVEYPVMARLFVTVIQFWETNTIEFVRRLDRDAGDLSDVFFDGDPLPEIEDLEINCSDPHFKGRGVMVVHFEDDRKLVYKPKSVGMEATFSEFIGWINRSLEKPLYVHTVLPREEYGWVEYIDQEPCESIDEVDEYYFRAGELLSILYAFSSTDIHHENLVAHGSQPVIIDYETLFHGQNHWFDPESAPEENSVMERFSRSVTRTAMLPQWLMRGPNRQAVETGGLSGPTKENQYTRTGWKNVNTDDMIRKKELFSPPPDNNLVLLEDEHQPVTDHLSSLVDGFTHGYKTLLHQRSALLDDWLPAFRDRTVRFLFRNTQAYSSLLNDSFGPQYLRDGVRFEINLEKLMAGFLSEQEKPPAWVLHRAELDHLLRLDIPLFGLTTGETELSHGVEQPVPDFLMESGLGHSRETIEGMDVADCEFQVRIIEGCVESLGVDRGNVTVDKNGETGAEETEIDWMAEAASIRETILDQALEDPDGSLQWLTTMFEAQGERARFRPVDETLYGGKAGIALFLAADDFVRGHDENRDRVDNILAPRLGNLRRWLKRDGFEDIPSGMGGFTGIGSDCYVLTRLGDFYGDDTYHSLALELSRRITPRQVRRDDTYDLMAGTAGTLQALLSLYEATGSRDVLKPARLCGDHLRDNQQAMGDSAGAWDTIGEFPVTGLAHGASGIMLALERLYQVTGKEPYRDAVRRALTFERQVFDEHEKNWPDYRSYNPFKDSDEETPFMVTWCAGAPGIVLSRLKLMETIEDHEFLNEIDAGFETTLEDGSKWAIDHYCCGDMARFEILRRVKDQTDINTNGVNPHDELSTMVSRARETGGYRLLGQFDLKYQPPGLMTGLAGIGYGLLYWEHSDVLPDVLVLE